MGRIDCTPTLAYRGGVLSGVEVCSNREQGGQLLSCTGGDLPHAPTGGRTSTKDMAKRGRISGFVQWRRRQPRAMASFDDDIEDADAFEALERDFELVSN